MGKSKPGIENRQRGGQLNKFRYFHFNAVIIAQNKSTFPFSKNRSVPVSPDDYNNNNSNNNASTTGLNMAVIKVARCSRFFVYGNLSVIYSLLYNVKLK